MLKKAALALSAALSMMAPVSASAQDMYLGEIRWFPYNFCPHGWTYAAGQTINVSQNTALFSLLGTTYGGNGQTTFMLPDLRGRVMVAAGYGAAGLQGVSLGQVGGVEYSTPSYAQLPSNVVTASPTPVAVAKAAAGADASTTVNVPSSYAVTGSNQVHENHQPYLALQACIATLGIYPSRD